MNMFKQLWDSIVNRKRPSGQLLRRVAAPPVPVRIEPVKRDVFPEQRHSSRYDFGGRAHVHFENTRAYADCVVLDASRSGARVRISHEVALRPLQGISIFFHGFTLRKRVKVAWQRATDDGLELGLHFMQPDVDVPVLDKFVHFLTWQAAARAA